MTIEYDVSTRTGTVRMAGGECAQMTPTIELFQRIDPTVERIITYAGEHPHHIYERCDRGFWIAYFAPPRD